MQFFSTFSSVIISALVLTVAAGPVMIYPRLVSEGELKVWLANTDANVTFAGGSNANKIGSRQLATTTVVVCTDRINDICGGSCTVHANVQPSCIDAPGTSCLMATKNVGFCDKGGCGGSCNQLSTCGTRLSGDFCFTPGTKSVLIGA